MSEFDLTALEVQFELIFMKSKRILNWQKFLFKYNF